MLKIALATIGALGAIALCACGDAQETAPVFAAPAPTGAPAATVPAVTTAPGAELTETDSARAEIQATLDARLSRELGVPAKVDIETLRVEAPWAFVSGSATTLSGGEIDFSNTKMAEQSSEGMMDGPTVVALLRKASEGGWAVVEIQIGSTDVPQVGWPEQYHVSPALVGQEAAEGSQ